MSHLWSERYGRISVDVVTLAMGNDLCLVITGGTRPHLGAVAVAQVRPSLADAARLSASTSVITLLGHKEDTIARQVAHTLAARLNKNVVVCCGIHVDNITADELNFVEDAVQRFCRDFSS
ncbi:MAG: proteasome assembly chaperone 4 family protein [Terriglobales bacterium]